MLYILNDDVGKFPGGEVYPRPDTQPDSLQAGRLYTVFHNGRLRNSPTVAQVRARAAEGPSK